MDLPARVEEGGGSCQARDVASAAARPSPDLCIHALFEAQAARRPDAVAVRHGEVRVTYRTLDARSNQLAHRLQALGVGPGSLIGLCVEPSVETIVGILGILKAGGAYVPLDPAHPPDRIAFMLEDARIRVVVTTSGLLAGLPAVTFTPVLLDGAELAAEPSEPTASQARPVDLAYVIYTSGSTGRPKGVLVQHDNVTRLFSATDAWFHFGPDDVWTLFHSSAFDFSVWEIWGALLYGGTLVVVPWRVTRDPEAFYALLRRERVTVLNQTPSAFQQLMPVDEAVRADDLALRTVVFGGEALDLASLRGWFERHGDAHPRLVNMYGITETTVHVTYRPLTAADAVSGRGSLIGIPIPDLQFHLLEEGRPVPDGQIGEIFVGGGGVARGYLNRPEFDAERFVPDRFSDLPGARLYRTGDLARRLPDGEVEYRGRADDQIKLGGHRIELGEVQAALGRHPRVRQAVAMVREDAPGDRRLVAYVVPAAYPAPGLATELRDLARAQLPVYAVPSAVVVLEKFPINVNGKVDRRALPVPCERPDGGAGYVAPSTSLERRLAAVWEEVLGVRPVGSADSFFDLGGGSLLATRMAERLRAQGLELPVIQVFELPRLSELARFLEGREATPGPAASSRGPTARAPIAIVGMAGRFPGARSVEQLWENVCAGLDTVTFFRDAELDPTLPASLRADPAYVKARGILDDVDLFDAPFFGASPREAEMLDPQQRVLLELAWEALERAGHVPERFAGAIGVFAGKHFDSYYDENVRTRPDLIERYGELNTMIANDKHFVATHIAHKLDLTGPALSVHSACSTSLVAVCQAVHSLRLGECDLALAGGASITVPVRSGYLYQEGGMLSSDGHCRPFDAQASGTTFSDGAALLVLRRLDDALADGDAIYGIIRGVALNNDGARRASFTAPSVPGQAAVIRRALADACVEPRSISYVETHGTGTPLGDPIEIEALTRAFRAGTADQGFCAVGSVKSNVGHLVIAAGATGLIKTALALHHRKLPPTAHFERPNPRIPFEGSPFFVQARLAEWLAGAGPRRAGVSSFGVGGTNAHVIVEEAPPVPATAAARAKQLLVLSARTASALDAATGRLRDHLRRGEDPLADVAFTLQTGRQAFAHRRFLVAEDAADATAALDPAARRLQTRHHTGGEPAAIFMFPGQGSQHVDMARSLYRDERVFRDAVDRCAEALRGELDRDLRQALYPASDPAAAALVLQQTSITQPALFTIEYALARLWESLGVHPKGMIGHSVGEFVCAALAGVMPVEDALRLVAARGRLMQALPAGAMLSVSLSAEAAAERLRGRAQLAIASDNAPQLCVVAGPKDEVAALQRELEAAEVGCRLLVTSHAFHSSMMDPAVAPFEQLVRSVPLAPPRTPFVSTATGTWITDEEATDPAYWARHLRATVRFTAGVKTLLAEPGRLLLEVGPRGTLSAMARRQVKDPARQPIVASLGDGSEAGADRAAFLTAAGQLWLSGVGVDWSALHAGERRRRVVLPTYPFERKRYWIDPACPAAPETASLPPAAAPIAAASPPPPAPSSLAESTVTATSPAPSTASRRVGEVLSLLEEVTGLELAGADPACGFVELGLDSLFLTQAALQVQKRFGVKVTFRQLSESFTTVAALAAHLDAALPPAQAERSVPVPAPAAPVAPAPLAAPGAAPLSAEARPPGTVQWLIEQQLQIMAQQLAVLGGTAAAPKLAAAPVVAAVSVPAPAPLAPAPAAGAAPPPPAAAYDPKKAFGAIARIHLAAEELTPKQRARLDAFIRRYTARTRESKRLTQENRAQLADPRVVTGFRPPLKEIVYQITVDRSAGARLWDVDGNEYVDVLCGFGSCFFGWQPKFVTEAITAQLARGYEIGPMHPLAGEVARLVCELTGFERAGFCNTGSEAVLGAVRVARTVTGRSTIAIFSGSYHGIFDEVIARGTKTGRAIPAAPGIMSEALQNVLVLDYGTPETLEALRARAGELAAVLVEPVQSRRPDFQPREFLHELRKLTAEAGVACIFDEMVTGFRTAPGGAQEHFGVRADLATYGKVIAGGFPMGIIAGKSEWMDALDGGSWQYGDASVPPAGVTYFAGTFVRHPLALAACKAVLEHLKREGPGLQRALTERTAAFAAGLNAWFRQVGAPIELRHFGPLWKTFFTAEHPLQELLFWQLRDRGVHILEGFPCFFTTAHTAADFALVEQAFRASVAELQEAGFLPGQPAPALDGDRPPVPGARLGRDRDGNPAWFVPNPDAPGKYLHVHVKDPA